MISPLLWICLAALATSISGDDGPISSQGWSCQVENEDVTSLLQHQLVINDKDKEDEDIDLEEDEDVELEDDIGDSADDAETARAGLTTDTEEAVGAGEGSMLCRRRRLWCPNKCIRRRRLGFCNSRRRGSMLCRRRRLW